MMRAALAAVLLLGCSPTIAPPPHWVHGEAVEYRLADLHGASGGAAWEGATPVVYLDLGASSPAYQWWVLAHELCHLEGRRAELAADCCAAAWLRRLEIPVDEVALAAQTWRTDDDHPAGAVRAATIVECYQ